MGKTELPNPIPMVGKDIVVIAVEEAPDKVTEYHGRLIAVGTIIGNKRTRGLVLHAATGRVHIISWARVLHLRPASEASPFPGADLVGKKVTFPAACDPYLLTNQDPDESREGVVVTAVGGKLIVRQVGWRGYIRVPVGKVTGVSQPSVSISDGTVHVSS